MLTEEGIATVPMVAVELVAAMGGGAIVADAVRVIVGGEELDTDELWERGFQVVRYWATAMTA